LSKPIYISATTSTIIFLFIIVAPCILKSILFTHQQKHYLLNLERFKIYTNIAPTCFGLRPSSGSLY
jgi:hypothetical protein